MALRTSRAVLPESAVRKALIACLALTVAILARAAGIGLKPGLWEVRLVKQVVDGRDMSAQISKATTQMEQAMANMPPQQRARMQAMLKQHGVGLSAHGGFRICVTPEMARRNAPVLDGQGRCQPTRVTRSGNRMTYVFSCNSKGITTTGKGVETIEGDRVTTRTDATTETGNGEKHMVQSESEMSYVGPHCGDVTPAVPPK
jgi:hypothetical protein